MDEASKSWRYSPWDWGLAMVAPAAVLHPAARTLLRAVLEKGGPVTVRGQLM